MNAVMTSNVNQMYAAVAASPDDAHLRAVLADALEEAEESVACRWCAGRGDVAKEDVYGYLWDETCGTCDGTGYVSNGAAALAEGYRALAESGVRAYTDSHGKSVLFFATAEELMNDQRNDPASDLPIAWYKVTEGVHPDGTMICEMPDVPLYKVYASRRAAEDAAAMAWTRMTDGDREACRAELT